MDMEVDIISMSWSFYDSVTDYSYSPVEKSEFKALIAEAKKKILLFASLNDKEGTKNAEYCPANLTDVFKIGSSNNSKMGANFLFPGDNMDLPDIDNTHEVVKGSSLATALAAGLAGLVLYSLTAHQACIDEENREKAKERLKQAKTVDGMRRIFNILSGNSQETTPSDVIVHLDNKFRLVNEENTDEEVLRKFVESISP
jgi:hypothetical protein